MFVCQCGRLVIPGRGACPEGHAFPSKAVRVAGALLAVTGFGSCEEMYGVTLTDAPEPPFADTDTSDDTADTGAVED